MRKIRNLLPVMIYPYAYVPFVVAAIVSGGSLLSNSIFIAAVIISAILINAFVIYVSIRNSILSTRDEISSKESARNVLLIKLVHIPAFIFHFLIGVLGLFLSVFGIPLVIWAFVIDFLTIGISGIASIGNSIKMYKKGYYSSKLTALAVGILNFIYCLDVLVAIVNYFKTSGAKNTTKERAKLNPR